jgi:glutamate racemase
VKITAASPIGVFDSGVGGLTVFKALRKALPKERLIYFGDTARLPYGTKSPEVVKRFSLEIAQFMSGRGIKLFVTACNTASALALPALQKLLPVPVLGVIDPAVRAAAAHSRTGRIGVIGTRATIDSGAYQKALRGLGRGRLQAQACPLFVPLIEEGWWEHGVTRRVAEEYLAPLREKGVDALILGCTHYPMIKPLLSKTMGRRVQLIDSAQEVAREAASVLQDSGLARLSGRGSEAFFVTDGAARFRSLLQRILGGAKRRIQVVRFPF